ncbi:MAG TPA: HlyD family secretion protein [Bryobacteraceae bacterium]|nr:HlyD family secretion protein [Bryobacteraceae bacterium]
MPQPENGDARPGDRLALLYEEQARLRTEIDRLRSEHDQLRNQKPADENQNKEDENKEPPRPPLRKRAVAWIQLHPILTLLLVAGLIVLIIAGTVVWNYLESYESTDDAEVGGHTDPISSRITGRVIGVYVENTQTVVKGQVLVDLDPKDYEVAVAQARANLAQSEAALQAASPSVPITQTTEQTNVASTSLDVASAEAELSAAERNYDAALADVEQSEANEANAAAEEARYRLLVEKQEVSRESYDQRLTTLRALHDMVDARKASAEAARRNVQQRTDVLEQARKRASEAQANSPRRVVAQRADVATRRAAIEAADARLRQALLNLSYCKIFAPAPGIVGDKTVEVGSYVSPGQELFAITQINDLWVTANFKETQIRNMHPGQTVTIHVDALSQDFNGYVENLPGATGAEYSLLPPENATGNFVKVVQRLPVRIRFKPGQPNAQRLRPGMSVEPKVWVK